MRQRPQQTVAPVLPLRADVRPVIFVRPDGSTLSTIPLNNFAPGFLVVSEGNDGWEGYTVQFAPYLIVMETEDGLAVFDLREVELFMPL